MNWSSKEGKWHKWFAWRPVKIYHWNGYKPNHKWVWLETIERLFDYNGYGRKINIYYEISED